MSDEKAQTPRDLLRSAAFAEDLEHERTVVEFRGQKYEVRAPTVKQKKFAENVGRKRGGDGPMDEDSFAISLIIQCTYVPGTEERVFEAADMDTFLARPITPTSVFQALLDGIKTLAKPESPEEVEKNS